MKVVIADDVSNICEGIQLLIETMFPELEIDGVFSSGTKLMKYLDEHTPDLLISDVRMPGYDGLDACQKLRERSKTAQIILVTAYQDFESAKRAIQYQVKELIVKPFSSEEMARAISNALDEEVDMIASDFVNAVQSIDITPFIKRHGHRIDAFTPKQMHTLFFKANQMLQTDIQMDEQNMGDAREALRLYTQIFSSTDTRKHLVLNAKNYIKEHYPDAALSQLDVAEALNVNPSYLSRIFSSEYEIGMSAYIKKVRIRAAKELLAKNDDTIDNIAIAVGFTSSSYFYRTFKNETGLTPADYQRRILDHETE